MADVQPLSQLEYFLLKQLKYLIIQQQLFFL